jgi:hypothetical protein
LIWKHVGGDDHAALGRNLAERAICTPGLGPSRPSPRPTGGSGVVTQDELTPVAVAGFLVDAARSEISPWTVVNVLRTWIAEGTPPETIHEGAKVARTHAPQLTEFLEAYEQQLAML